MITGDNKKIILPDVSFITTVYNEEKSIIEFLESLMEQIYLPGEIIIVDGGSKDKTFEITLGFFRNKASQKDGDFRTVLNNKNDSARDEINKRNNKSIVNVRIIKKSGANISQGRNTAIKNALGRIICVSDAGCILNKNWLKEITRFYDDTSCNVIGGLNLPFCWNFIQKCLAVCIVPARGEIKVEKYMPSSRNISFKKKIWVDVGGYPEDMDYGEDMKFDFNIKAADYRIRFNPDAVVYWKMRKNPVQIFWQFFRYAKGDAMGRMYPVRHLIRFSAFLTLLIILISAFCLSKWILIILALLFVVYVFKPYSKLVKGWSSNESCSFYGVEKFLSILFIPLLLIQIDLSKMCGYIYGLFKKIIKE